VGNDIHQYALRFFRGKNGREYHLRVSPANIPARRFYKKIGMKEMGPELDGKVIRMKGEIGK
jgi:RimJ/RimL family protein N-acetyltransferase